MRVATAIGGECSIVYDVFDTACRLETVTHETGEGHVHWLDWIILATYALGMLAVGVYFQRRQTGLDEFFVGGRNMGAGHVGLSVVATDVGGGFSIGLGGLGFAIGLSASWLLFTGLVGAWLAAVVLIPRVKQLGDIHGDRSYPAFIRRRFGPGAALVAALVSAIGYAAFTGSQLLAGGTLAAAAFDLSLNHAVLLMSVIIVVYTAFGGLQAVIYTDSLQWTLLFGGLIGLGLPLGYRACGGWQGLKAALPPEFFTLTNVTTDQILTWGLSIIPIWFVAMTLYQRIHAARDVGTARRAWFLAGLLEWPMMAFMGATLGMFSRVLYPAVEAEMGLPLLIRDVLPVGATGIVLAAYFAAIMSTADSCLLASIGNVVDDIVGTTLAPATAESDLLRLSRGLTLVVGFGSVAFALLVPSVLESILLAYAFMVGGLFIPTLAALFVPRASGLGALLGMVAGGATTVTLSVLEPAWAGHPMAVGLAVATLGVVLGSVIRPNRM
jgi:SSS family solute:Na+ symporter